MISIRPSRAIKLSRSQRRELKKLDKLVDRVTRGDRRFFERFSKRQYRVRLATEAEIAQQEIFDGEPLLLPSGRRAFVAVLNVVPGERLRVFAYGPGDATPDLMGEDEAREIFEAVASPYLLKIARRRAEELSA